MPDLSPAEVTTEENPCVLVHYILQQTTFNDLSLKNPYLVTSPQAPLGPPMPCSSSPAATAEAPELSYGEVWKFAMYGGNRFDR